MKDLVEDSKKFKNHKVDVASKTGEILHKEVRQQGIVNSIQVLLK
jgi:hypothetical protein